MIICIFYNKFFTKNAGSWINDYWDSKGNSKSGTSKGSNPASKKDEKGQKPQTITGMAIQESSFSKTTKELLVSIGYAYVEEIWEDVKSGKLQLNQNAYKDLRTWVVKQGKRDEVDQSFFEQLINNADRRPLKDILQNKGDDDSKGTGSKKPKTEQSQDYLGVSPGSLKYNAYNYDNDDLDR